MRADNPGGEAPAKADAGTHGDVMLLRKKRQRKDGQASRMPRCASGVRALRAPGTAKEAGLGTCDQQSLTFPSPSRRPSTQVSTR